MDVVVYYKDPSKFTAVETLFDIGKVFQDDGFFKMLDENCEKAVTWIAQDSVLKMEFNYHSESEGEAQNE